RISNNDLNTGKRICKPGDVRYHSVPWWNKATLERGLGKDAAFTTAPARLKAQEDVGIEAGVTKDLERRNDRRAAKSNRICNSGQVRAPSRLGRFSVVLIAG